MLRLILLLIAFVLAMPVAAQPASAPTIPAAEQAFQRGLQQFRAGQYEAAYQAFIRAATDFEFNQRTTAAYLMAGKAVYALGETDAAIEAMTMFLEAYPVSRYRAEAERVRERARAYAASGPSARAVTTLGVALPLDPSDRPFAQALFNGLRLAVDEHNAGHPERPVRLVFRDTRGDEAGAAAAMTALQQAGAALVVGPLYSEEAAGAAPAAEQARLPLVAPLATDEAVSAGRRYVFQANPTFAMRGRQMARFALAAGFERIGVAVVTGTLAETEADAFIAELASAGRFPAFIERLASADAWPELARRLGPERLALADVLYAPVSGGAADEQATALLRSLADAGVGPERLRVIGSTEFQGADAAAAARYRTHFTSDFFLDADSDAADPFVASYRALAGRAPDRLAYRGYDLGTMLLAELRTRSPETPVADALRGADAFEGLAHRFHFAGEQVNGGLFVLRFQGRDIFLVE